MAELEKIDALIQQIYGRLNGLQIQATGQNIGIMANVYAGLEQIAELSKAGDENGAV